MRDRSCAERALPVTANAQNVTVGETGLHPHSAALAGDATAAVHVRNKQVSRLRTLH